MCRLFGLRAGRRVVTATFWLLQAPDNLVEQSRRNPDGTGIGVFGADGTPVLYMLDRRDISDKHLRMDSHRISAHSEHLTDDASIVFASEPMDDDDWQLLAPGELVHVDADLRLTRRIAFPDPPKHQLRHEDLTAQAASSQHASVA